MRALSALFRRQKGSMATLVAVLLPVVLGLVGLGIDSGMLYLSHSRLQAAVDAAALAGSLQLPYDPQLDKGLVRGAVTQYMDANYPEASLNGVTPGTEERSVTVTATATVPTIFGNELALIAKMEQRVVFRIGDQIDVTSTTTITAIGAATRNIFFTPECGRTVTTVTGTYYNCCLIKEIGFSFHKRINMGCLMTPPNCVYF